MYRALLVGMGMSLLAGCGTVPVKYDEKSSYAMNVARAANIDAALKDVAAPQDTMASFTDSAAYGFAYAASGYSAPVKGFTPTSAMAMNFASWLLSPEEKSARNHLIAWMPEEQAGDNPVDRLTNILLEAANKAAHESGYTTEAFIIEKRGLNPKLAGMSLLKSEGDICTSDEGPKLCWVAFGVEKPRRLKHAPDIVGAKGGTYFFDPSKAFRSYFMFPKENSGLNELELLTRLSQHTPDWVYFYVAPKKIRIGRDQPIKLPLIINQGKIHYFVKPEDDPLALNQEG